MTYCALSQHRLLCGLALIAGNCLTGCGRAPDTRTGTVTPEHSYEQGSMAPADAGTSRALESVREGSAGNATSSPTHLASAPNATNDVTDAAGSLLDATDARPSTVDDAGQNTEQETAPGGAPEIASCASPFPITCGARLTHDTRLQGQANQFNAYGCSARNERGRESVYRLDGATGCEVEVRLTNAAVDLDLFLVAQCQAELLPGKQCSSTPLDLQDVERVAFVAASGESELLVVDGYAESEGSYTLEVECNCLSTRDAGTN